MGVTWNNPPLNPAAAFIYLGTPVATSGIAGTGVTVNGVSVPSFPYPTLQECFGHCLLSGPTATDTFDLGLYTQINSGAVNSAPSKQRMYSSGSAGPLFVTSKVAAGQQISWTMQVVRSAGTTATCATFADGNFNALQVVVTPAV